MKEKEVVDLRFFRLLLPGFSKRMPLPENFYKQISMNENRKTASLVTYSGKICIWHVDFYKENEQMYVEGQGWEDFIQANALKEFYMLVFRYRGNMIFTFKVFDEKNYNVKENEIFVNYEDQNSDNFQNPTKISCKEEDLIDSSSKKLARRSFPHHIVNEKDHKTSKPRTISPEDQNTSKAMTTKFATGICFHVTMSAYHLTSYRWHIRKDGIRITALEKLNEIILRDQGGRLWRVTIVHHKRNGRNLETCMSKGLRRFARMNFLKKGDTCIFEAEGNSNVLGVRIIRR